MLCFTYEKKYPRGGEYYCATPYRFYIHPLLSSLVFAQLNNAALNKNVYSFLGIHYRLYCFYTYGKMAVNAEFSLYQINACVFVYVLKVCMYMTAWMLFCESYDIRSSCF